MNKLIDSWVTWRIGGLSEFARLCCQNKCRVVGKGYLAEALKEISKLLREYDLAPEVQVDIDKKCLKLQRKYREGQRLDSTDAEHLGKSISGWINLIGSALGDRPVIEVFTGGTLNYREMLKKGPKIFFEDNVWKTLSKIAKMDLWEASRCLLGRLWTAATMISLRAAEDALRNYYKFKTGKDGKGKGWGKIIGELKKLPEISKPLIGYLDYIRDVRNAAEHPEKIFSCAEAERVIHQVVNIIEITHNEMLSKEEKVEVSKSLESKKMNRK